MIGTLAQFAGWPLIALVVMLCALRPLGPAWAGLNRWTSAGPEGGGIHALAIDPRTPGVVYAGTTQGVFKSTAGGKFWSPINTGLIPLPGVRFIAGTEQTITALAIDPQSPVTLYAGTFGDGDGHGSSPTVFKSTNGGATWSPTGSRFAIDNNAFVKGLAFDSLTPSTLYASMSGAGIASSKGVFKSMDGGASWIASNSGLIGLEIEALAIDPRSPAILYTGTHFGVFKSINSGASWSPAGSASGNLTVGGVVVAALAIDPLTASTVYAGTRGSLLSPSASISGRGVFKSTDGGISWIARNVGLNGLEINVLAIDPRNPATLYAGTDGGAFKSINAGASWSPANTGLTLPLITVLVIDPQAPATLYAGTKGGGAFKSTDGGASWNPINASLTASQVQAVVINPQTPTILYAGLSFGGVFKSTNGGASWRPSNVGLTDLFVSALIVDPQTPSTLYAGGILPGVSKSTDGGGRWNASGVGIVGIDTQINALAIDPQTPTTLYAAGGQLGRVFKSTDGGASWIESRAGIISATMTALAVDSRNPATLYAGSSSSGGLVYKSINGGASWTQTVPGPAFSVFALAIDPQTPAIVYAGTAGGVSKSIDGGSSWTRSLTSEFVKGLVIDPHSPSTLYAIAVSGAFKSTDSGATWNPINIGLTAAVNAIAVNPTGRCVHAGSSAGIFTFATRLDSECLPPPPLVAAVLPASRSVQMDSGATAFASITNAGVGNTTSTGTHTAETDVEGVTCGITQLTGLPTPFTFQATDPTTNQPIGQPNTPVNIAAGANQTFVISLTPMAAFIPTDVQFGFNCSNTDLAPTVVGVNTLLLTASPTPVPDIVALAATLHNDGIVSVPGALGTGAFAVATSNVGAGGNITASADTGASSLPISIALCQTNPVSGACLVRPGTSVTSQISAGATPTFAIFVSGTGAVPFDPASNRVFVRFKDSAGITRGATSVAVRTQ